MTNHTDKELLELAAKAAGIRGEWNEACSKFEKLGNEGWYAGFFEPLTDDGDALRLAVKLKLDFYVDEKDAGCWISDFVCLYEDSKQDPYAATRRAIVRAAAAIGSKL